MKEIQPEKSIPPSPEPEEMEARSASQIERDAREMELAMPAGAAGLAFWLPAGMRLREALMRKSWSMHERLGYMQVKSPALAPRELFERSGHADKYAEMMFAARSGRAQADQDAALMLRPMSCPNHLAIFGAKRRSIHELPWRVFEFGEVYRDEPSGSLAFLLRSRQFCQDDAHVVAPLSQSGAIAKDWLGMALEAAEWMGCGKPQFRLALRPDNRIGSDAHWDLCEGLLRKSLSEAGIQAQEAPGEGAFYGPKIELAIADPKGRLWQMGVMQLDLNLPERFELKADGHANPKSDPLALIHHAVFGSIERAIGVMIACHGKNLPEHAHPKALAVMSLSEKADEAAARFAKSCQAILGDRAIFWKDPDPLGVKIAKAKEAGWLRIAVIGPREARQGEIAAMEGQSVDPNAACEGLADR